MIETAKNDVRRLKVAPVDDDELKKIVMECMGQLETRINRQGEVLEKKGNASELLECN